MLALSPEVKSLGSCCKSTSTLMKKTTLVTVAPRKSKRAESWESSGGMLKREQARGKTELNIQKSVCLSCLLRLICKKLVMKLVAFELVDVHKIPLPTEKTKEERAKEICEAIVDLTPVARPVHISHMVACSCSSSDNDATSKQSMNTGPFDWIDGAAIKQKNGTWRVTMSNGKQLDLSSDKMLALPKTRVAPR
jgi:hypothetical protein